MTSGLLVVDKPVGLTSHDVVARARKAHGTRHVGHTGTLDPFATGVLVLGFGEGLKIAAWLTDQDKEYEALVALGAETDSLDHTGTVVRTAPVPTLEGLGAALAAEAARLEQIPPQASAIHIEGQRAHELLRRGEVVAMPARPVAVRQLTLLGIEAPDLVRIRVHCAKGYYVRALARDLAERLGTVGHLRALRRTRSGAFTIAEAGPVDAPLIPLEIALRRLFPCVTVTDPDRAQAFRHGKRLPRVDEPAAGLFVLFDDRPLALARVEGELVVVQRGFR